MASRSLWPGKPALFQSAASTVRLLMALGLLVTDEDLGAYQGDALSEAWARVHALGLETLLGSWAGEIQRFNASFAHIGAARVLQITSANIRAKLSG